MFRVGAVAMPALALAGCAIAPECTAVPEHLAEPAAIPDLGAVRAWGDTPFSRYMKALCAIGFRPGRAGYSRAKAPPEVFVEAQRRSVDP